MKRLASFFSAKRSDFIAFDGSPGPDHDFDVEFFIRAVRKHSLLKGRHGDNLWTAQFASTCLQGSALRWYETLPESIQNDWTQLCVALTDSYAPAEAKEGRPAGTSSSSVPSSGRRRTTASPHSVTQWSRLPEKVHNSDEASSSFEIQASSRLPKAIQPAQEPRAFASLSTRVPTPPRPVGGRRGIIEVFVPGWRAESLYISKELQHGSFSVGAGKSTALRVWYYWESGDMILENYYSRFSSPGLTWSSKTPDTGKSSSDSAQIAAVGGPSNNNADISTSSSWNGVTWASWQVGRRGLLVPNNPLVPWDPSGPLQLAVYVGDGSMRLYIVSSFDAFASWMGDGYKEGLLWFEDV